jgi:hypothetical protein
LALLFAFLGNRSKEKSSSVLIAEDYIYILGSESRYLSSSAKFGGVVEGVVELKKGAERGRRKKI